MMVPASVNIEVLMFRGCPNVEEALALARGVAAQLGPGITVARTDVDTPERAAEAGLAGTPSYRVNGAELERRSAVSCPSWTGGGGLPPRWLIEAAVLRELRPRGVLFLCVANSARSQMAEGIARALLPDHVGIWSAGSQPTRVRPEAITVLAEIGIDISGHRSKHVAEIDAGRVDTVVTLCEEEECPVFLGTARRVRWGLPDPAAAGGAHSQRFDAFRRTRDELIRRISVLAGASRQPTRNTQERSTSEEP